MATENPNPNPNDNGGNPDDKGGEDKKFTQEQVDSMISERLKKEGERTQKQIDDAIAKATKDAEEKAKLSSEEREKADREERDRKTAEREKELSLREARIEAKDILQSKGIDSELVEFVVDADLDKTKANIDKLEKSFTKAVEAQVAEKLKGKSREDYSNNNGDDKDKPKATGRIAF